MSRIVARFSTLFAVTLSVFAMGIGLAGTQQAKPTPTRVDLDMLGPKVGEAVPDFNLRDQAGDLRPLRSLIGPNGAIVVFFRSADW